MDNQRTRKTHILAFKHKLNIDINKPPQYYLSGKRLGRIHHTRIRINCSSLKQHLFLKMLFAVTIVSVEQSKIPNTSS